MHGLESQNQTGTVRDEIQKGKRKEKERAAVPKVPLMMVEECCC
jgi:hypothetical protein